MQIKREVEDLVRNAYIAEFRVVRPLGKGGMGAVYEVETSDGGRFALKLFTSSGARADFLRKRFIAEGKILSCLGNQHLVTVHDIGFEPTGGAPYFTMDLVLDEHGEPCTLEDVRKRGGLDERRISAIYADVRSALRHLHANGVVHRDVKLENVLVDANGRAILSDFGISRILCKELREELAVTTTFAADHAPIMGSAGYLSPELKAGAAATPSDDAWALGVLVFRLLTGVWYEEDSSAMDLLAGFDLDWNGVLSVLLNSNPSKRLPLPEPPSLGVAKDRKKKMLTAIALATAVAAAVVAIAVSLKSLPAYEFDEFFPPLSGEVAL